MDDEVKVNHGFVKIVKHIHVYTLFPSENRQRGDSWLHNHGIRGGALTGSYLASSKLTILELGTLA
jgi:hypothetical protein